MNAVNAMKNGEGDREIKLLMERFEDRGIGPHAGFVSTALRGADELEAVMGAHPETLLVVSSILMGIAEDGQVASADPEVVDLCCHLAKFCRALGEALGERV